MLTHVKIKRIFWLCLLSELIGRYLASSLFNLLDLANIYVFALSIGNQEKSHFDN